MDKIQKIIVKQIGEEVVDESLLEYLTNVVSDWCNNVSDGDASSSSLAESLGPFLQSYCSIDDEAKINNICSSISSELLKSGVIKTPQSSKATGKSPQKPKNGTISNSSAEKDEDQNGDDDWGIAHVKVKNMANTVVDTIESAQEKRRREKKAERAQRKEEKKEQYDTEQSKGSMLSGTGKIVLSDAMDGSGTSGDRNVIIDNFSMSASGSDPTMLLEDTSLRIISGKRYGLLGRNGIGKTTLLRHIAAREIDGFPKNISILHVEQEVVGDDATVLDCVLSADGRLKTLREQEAKLSQEVEKNSSLLPQLNEVYAKLEALDAGSAESRARTILNGLEFTIPMQDAKTKTLSGGWRMRVALACALFVTPDLLMLDEPTNHLSLEAILWLEAYLSSYPHTLIIVSHDRVFLNNCITDVMHIENKKLVYYKGDIDTFERTRKEHRLQQERERESQMAKKEHMEKFVERFRYNANRARLVQSRIKAINKMDIPEELFNEPTFTFVFPEPAGTFGGGGGGVIIRLDDVSFRYPPKADASSSSTATASSAVSASSAKSSDKTKWLFEHVNLSISTDSRIVLLGPNGAGKSTLLHIMLGDLEPTKGKVDRNGRARIAFFSQHHVDQLDMSMNPLDFFLKKFHGSTPADVRAHLANFGIPATLATQRIGTLSGGQKSRVCFALITWTKPHLIIMDEPSNHLDLETVDALMMACSVFEGGLVIVSHDQQLISTIGEELHVLQHQQLTRLKGDFATYKKSVLHL